ncbi:MAG: hypothetical protein PHV34_19140 [Verrucomicrobiae bacterium]|nr:hypothetical protein [Verrucomicrobiae bacterium]
MTELYPGDGFSVGKQLAAAFASATSAITIMSFAGIAVGVGIFLVVILAVLVYAAQLLLEAVLIAFGPMALATVAFTNFKGIGEMWLKYFVGVFLIPAAWLLGAKFYSNVSFMGKSGGDLLASILFSCIFGAIYAVMPVITAMIVNAAGGSVSAAMPSIMSNAASVLGMARGGAANAIQGASAASTLSTSIDSSGSVQHTISTAIPGNAPGASPSQQSAYEQRIFAAASHNEQWAGRVNQPNQTKSTTN